jgi:hypothetical protein
MEQEETMNRDSEQREIGFFRMRSTPGRGMPAERTTRRRNGLLSATRSF